MFGPDFHSIPSIDLSEGKTAKITARRNFTFVSFSLLVATHTNQIRFWLTYIPFDFDSVFNWTSYSDTSSNLVSPSISPSITAHTSSSLSNKIGFRFVSDFYECFFYQSSPTLRQLAENLQPVLCFLCVQLRGGCKRCCMPHSSIQKTLWGFRSFGPNFVDSSWVHWEKKA